MIIATEENLTLGELLAGDRPQLPKRTIAGSVMWYDVGSLPADKINYNDFQINKGEMTIGVGNNVFVADSNGIQLGHKTWASSPFRVNMSGTAWLENAVVSGEITATSGVIGGFTIEETQMYGGIIKTSANVGAGDSGVIMDTDGLRGYDTVLGEVFNIPVDGSPPSFSSGVINSTVFNLNTSATIRTSSTVGDGSSSSAGVLINDTGIYATQANQTLANANIQILATGEGIFSGSVKGGMTDYMTNEGYFMGLSSGVYKMSVGDPAGNYMSWDDEQLRIKGVIELDGPINLEGYATASLPIPPSSPGLTLPGSSS